MLDHALSQQENQGKNPGVLTSSPINFGPFFTSALQTTKRVRELAGLENRKALWNPKASTLVPCERGMVVSPEKAGTRKCPELVTMYFDCRRNVPFSLITKVKVSSNSCVCFPTGAV